MERDLNHAPLSEILVLDLSRVLAGPFAAMLLGELGARVIKIEHPKGGDEARGIGPFQNGISGYFMSVNKGKESLALDLKATEGKKIFLNLIEKADILVENCVLLELKTVDKLNNVHEAQLLNYLKATGIKVGLLINFYHQKAEIKRFVL